MAPKKKGGGKAETPEALAARRAAAMAMFQTTSTPKEAPARPGAAKPAAAKPAADAEPETDAAEKKLGALEVSDAREMAKADAASAAGGGSAMALTTSLPSGPEWAKILEVEPMPAMVKNAKKQGTESVEHGCKVFNLKDVAYLFDADGRSNVACWRTKLDGSGIGGGARPLVRFVGDKKAVVTGKASIMSNAIQTHTGCTLVLLPTGHVLLRGEDDAAAAAATLIDDLIDGDGEATRATLKEHLVVAEPWGGVLELPVPDEWVGAIIGKHGAGLKRIAGESGAFIDYIDPEEAAADGGGGGGGSGAAVDVSEGSGADASAAASGDEEGKPKATGGFFRIKGKFENQCRLAAKRIEERLALVQRLDVHGFVTVPRGAVGRLIGKGGANIKVLQRTSGATRLTFDKEPGGRATTQACAIVAADIEAAVGAAKVVLEAVPLDSAEARSELKSRLEDFPAQVLALLGGAAPPVDATRETAVEAHRAKFGSAVLSPDMQTKDKPAQLAAVDFDVWQWEWAVDWKPIFRS